MKAKIILLALLFNLNAYGQSVSNDFGEHSGEVKNLTAQDLRKNIAVAGSVYVLSPDGGKILSKGREVRDWSFGSKGDLVSNWSFSSDKIERFALKHVWSIDDKGVLSVHIKQYDSITLVRGKTEPNYGKLLREEKIQIKDFEPITWTVHNNENQKVIIRLTPYFKESDSPVAIGALPISGKNIVAIDSKDQVWLQDATFSGEYVGITTARGTIYMSYLPFRGSQEIGFAEGNRMKLTLSSEQKLSIVSAAPLLPSGLKAKVFGKVNFKEKAKSANSVHISSSDKEKEFLEIVK